MCVSSVFTYAGSCFFSLRALARAAKPVPRSSMVAGSGVGEEVVGSFIKKLPTEGDEVVS